MGLFGRSGVNTYARGTVDDNAVALFKAAMERGFLKPRPRPDRDASIQRQMTRLLTDDNNQFYGGGPFAGPYGGPQALAGA